MLTGITMCPCSSPPGPTAPTGGLSSGFALLGKTSARKTARPGIDPRARGCESRSVPLTVAPPPRTGEAAQGPWYADPPSASKPDHSAVRYDEEPAPLPPRPQPGPA